MWTRPATMQHATTSLNSSTGLLFPSCNVLKLVLSIQHYVLGQDQPIFAGLLLECNQHRLQSRHRTHHAAKTVKSFITDWAQNVQTVPKLGLFFSSYQWCRVTALPIFLQVLSLFSAYVVF
jgi:hypothetical protein